MESAAGPGTTPVDDDVVAAIADDLVHAVLDELAPVVAAYRREMGRRLGLDATEWQCLDVLRRLGPLPSGTLATRAGVTRGGISKALRRLESAGHVRRERSPDHRQEVVAVLVAHPLRDALLEGQRRRLRYLVRPLVARFRLDHPDRLAPLRDRVALVCATLHQEATDLGDAVVGARALGERRRADRARREERARRET